MVIESVNTLGKRKTGMKREKRVRDLFSQDYYVSVTLLSVWNAFQTVIAKQS